MLFDGVCNLCTASVRFVLARNSARNIRFASMQSQAGQAILQTLHLPLDRFDSFIFIENGAAYQKAGAVLRVGRHLSAPWRLASRAGSAIPRSLADAIYTAVARNRYRLFGKRAL